MPENKRPDVSICIPTMNRRKLLERNVNFFLNEGRPKASFEIAVSDSASSDDTPEYLKGLRNPQVRHRLHKKKLLQLENFNSAAALAKGKYIALFHDDNIYDARLIDAAAKILDAEQDVGVVCSGFYRATEDGVRSGTWIADIPERMGKREFIENLLRKGWSRKFELGITTLVFRKSLFRKIGGFPSKYPAAFDVHFFLLAVLSGSKIAYIKEPLATDITRKTNISYGRDAEYLRETHGIYLDARKHAQGLDVPSVKEIFSRSKRSADRLVEKNIALGNWETVSKILDFTDAELGTSAFQKIFAKRLPRKLAVAICRLTDSAKRAAARVLT